MQIADRLMESILKGEHVPGSRIPSVRDYAARLEVNANTVMRSFELLQSEGIIYNKRGLGYFVDDGAPRKIMDMRCEMFLRDEAPEFFRKARLLGFTLEELGEIYARLQDSDDND